MRRIAASCQYPFAHLLVDGTHLPLYFVGPCTSSTVLSFRRSPSDSILLLVTFLISCRICGKWTHSSDFIDITLASSELEISAESQEVYLLVHYFVKDQGCADSRHLSQIGKRASQRHQVFPAERSTINISARGGFETLYPVDGNGGNAVENLGTVLNTVA